MIKRLAIGLLLVTTTLLAQGPRYLHGELLLPGPNGQWLPAPQGITVTIKESGDQDTTGTKGGLFRIFLKDVFQPGVKITLHVDKEGWAIYQPTGGQLRIPSDPSRSVEPVKLLELGSALFLSRARIELLLDEVASKTHEQVVQDGGPEGIDLARYLKDWAVRYGFGLEEVQQEVDSWATEVEAAHGDLYRRGLAAFAKGHFTEAYQFFLDSGAWRKKKLEKSRS